MYFTRKGDDGSSSLFKGERLAKDDPIFSVLGTLDELNSLLGVCHAHSPAKEKCGKPMRQLIRLAQEDIFIIQAEIAGSSKQMNKEKVEKLESLINELSSQIENPNAFIIPGSELTSSYLDLARTVARRAEREVVALNNQKTLSEHMLRYLNRLSSYLYVLARLSATRAGLRNEPNPSY